MHQMHGSLQEAEQTCTVLDASVSLQGGPPLWPSKKIHNGIRFYIQSIPLPHAYHTCWKNLGLAFAGLRVADLRGSGRPCSRVLHFRPGIGSHDSRVHELGVHHDWAEIAAGHSTGSATQASGAAAHSCFSESLLPIFSTQLQIFPAHL